MGTHAKEGRAIRRRWILCLQLAPVCGKEGGVAVRSGNINQCQSCIGAAARSYSLQRVCLGLAGGLQLAQLSVSRDV